jgi:ADP-ribose pyrophosphatase
MRETTTSSKRLYEGRVLDLELRQVRLDDGRVSEREIVLHRGAVGVLARDPDGAYLLVRQFRSAVEAEALEICAGLHEPGEASEAAARRELREETGRTAATLTPLARVWASPGYTTEWVDLFFADCAPGVDATAFDHDEHVEVVRYTAAELDRAIRAGVVRDAKTIAAYGLHRLALGIGGAGAEPRA